MKLLNGSDADRLESGLEIGNLEPDAFTIKNGSHILFENQGHSFLNQEQFKVKSVEMCHSCGSVAG